MALPPGSDSRITPRSKLALRKFIDVGARAVDSDYKGESGVVLFNFGEENFVINIGDNIAKLIFEKINTLVIKETNDLGEIGRGK